MVSIEQLPEKERDGNIDPFADTVGFTAMKLCKKLGEPQLVETVAPGGGVGAMTGHGRVPARQVPGT
ncbi:hypothetical protein OR263_27475 [Streptomyces sp. NEAU-H22]|uniref:hypothetical protein n=1 Tax=unclassified Streptomyces TaxID=2593676 RepID=UPI00225B3AFB|nr:MULTISPECIES: hypothetical protein [unclassified Streptomyces]MCX3290407.1 hypothetical protein [Streptomyces sp. NEAU-H22]WMD07153.1 hypothetical protein Q7C01_23505 [Streptomyces sp. FXY-T5]